MKTWAMILAGLAMGIILSGYGAPVVLAQDDDDDLSYGSFNSFDPSEDFIKSPATKKKPASKKTAAPQNQKTTAPPPAEDDYSVAADDGRLAPYGSDAPDAGAPTGGHDQPASSGLGRSPEAGVYQEPASPPPMIETYPSAVAETPPPPAVAPAIETYPSAVVETPPPPPVVAPAAPVEPFPSAAPVPAALPLSSAVDYSQADNWISRPASADRSVDVFFLYTGACSRAGQGGGVCAVSDPGLRQKAQESVRRQAGAFEPVGNLFAPYYRQVNSTIFLGLDAEDRAGRLAVSAADAAAAFDYYMKNRNQGRPFILAAHGQGSAALLTGILADYFKAHPEAQRLMVAAYALGYSVTGDYLAANPHLKFAERRNDVGVIISYNTEAPGLTAASPTVLPRAVAINPVNWLRSEVPAKADKSLGADLAVFGGEEHVEHFADARVRLRRGVVECSTAGSGEYGSDLFPKGAYPGGDYAFYYYDLRANAQERADAFRVR